MKTYKLLLVGLLGVSTPMASDAQGKTSLPLWGNLRPGPHAVGFQIIYRLDRSRVWETGDSTLDQDPGRPIRVSVWYPARRDGAGRAMRFGDYVHVPPATRAFRRLNALLITRDTLSLRGAFAGAEKYRPSLDALRVFARLNTEPATGKFPLVLYSEGWNSSGQHDNSVLAEYLASHGYVVAMVPQVGPSADVLGLRVTLPDIEIQMRDLEFAMSVAHELPFVDRRSLALMGWSMGGVAQLLIAGRNSNVDAVIGLDASFRGASWVGLVTGSPYFHIRRLTAPLLALQSGHAQAVANESNLVLDSMHFAPRYIGRIPNVTHGDFSDFAMWASLFPVRIVDRTAVQALAGHEMIVRTVATFLDAVLKHNEAAMTTLRSDSVRIAKLDVREPAQVPTEAEFMVLLQREGLEPAVQQYRALKRQYPALSIIDYTAFSRLAYAALREQKQDLALKAFQLNAGIYPSLADAFDSLADGYIAKGDSVAARAAYQGVLRVLPADSTLTPGQQKEYRERAEGFIRARP